MYIKKRTQTGILATALLLAAAFSCHDKPAPNTPVTVKPPIAFATGPAPAGREMDTRFLYQAIMATDWDGAFYMGMAQLYGENYYLYLDKKDSLNFINLNTRQIHRTYIRPILAQLDDLRISLVHGHQLQLMNRHTKTFYQYRINPDFSLALQRKTVLGNEGPLKKLSFMGNWTLPPFACRDSVLFYNYGVRGPKNFIGPSAFVYFTNLNTQRPQPAFAVAHPPHYHTDEVRNADLLFDFANDSCLAFGYEQSDVLGLFNFRRNTVVQTRIDRIAQYQPFDVSKRQNLGYNEKYLQTNENNERLLIDSAGRILLFKQLYRKNKKDPREVDCYLLDGQLTPLRRFRINSAIEPTLIYNYRKGFLAFTDTLTKAYYYEL
jgi:hypothetical protein